MVNTFESEDDLISFGSHEALKFTVTNYELKVSYTQKGDFIPDPSNLELGLTETKIQRIEIY